MTFLMDLICFFMDEVKEMAEVDAIYFEPKIEFGGALDEYDGSLFEEVT